MQTVNEIKKKVLHLHNVSNSLVVLSKNIDSHLLSDVSDKKKNAEVSTPYVLRQEMLDKLPSSFWSTPKKVFEPCCGKGGFLIDILHRFMEGMKNLIRDDKERYRYIVENCLYWSDINPLNIGICKLLLDPDNMYALNYHEGDTLKIDIMQNTEHWKPTNTFDAVVGNPPYNACGNINTGNTIWQFFTYNSLSKWLDKNGYLVFVHPSGWRKPSSYKIQDVNLRELMTVQNHMLYLEIHDTRDGLKTFGCGTRYDWYVIHKKKPSIDDRTNINDENRNSYSLNLTNFTFIPNFDLLKYADVIGNYERAHIRCNVHSSVKKNVVKKETPEFKYKLVHSTPKSGVKYLYTDDNKIGYFGIKKLIFGDSGINDVIIDDSGEYGVTEHAICLKYDTLEEATILKKVLLSHQFRQFLKSCSWSNYQIDWKLFNHLKKDFVQYFNL